MKSIIILIIILQFFFIFSVKLEAKSKKETLVEADSFYNNLYSSQNSFSNSNALVSPILQHSIVVSNSNVRNHPVVSNSQCACASQIQPCQPCSSIYVHPIIEQRVCPCAPRPKCPVCPSLSLIHTIAAKKVRFYNNHFNFII